METMRMDRKHVFRWLRSAAVILVGSVLFSLGFDLFLQPNQINVGGVSGAGQLIAEVTGFGSVALWAFLINVPIFVVGLRSIGREFFFGSLLGMGVSSLLLEVFSGLPAPETEPLLATIYGGVTTGAGLGMVFAAGASTGGTDMLARILRPKFPAFPIGKVMMSIDLIIVLLTGVVFRDINKTLYSFVTLYVSSVVLDGVVYGLDYSTVALIISDKYKEIGEDICNHLERGVTLLTGEGYYSGQDKHVILSAIKKNQVSELKNLVIEQDPNAFIILQEAHQVLGDGFKRYDKNEL